MDGVLVDSEPLHLMSMQIFLSRYDIQYAEEDNREFLGRKDLLIAETLIERYGLKNLDAHQFVQAKEEILCDLVKNQAKARPGVYKTLAAAQSAQIPTALASSATLSTIMLVMETLEIGKYFLQFCSAEDVKNGKPAPDIFLLAANRLGVEAGSCMVIEDTLNGLKAAKAAGMYAVSIPCAATAQQDHSLADLSLASMEELRLEEIFGYNLPAETLEP